MIEKKFSEKVDIFSKYMIILDKAESLRKCGVVSKVVGNVLYSQGPPDSRIGEIMDVERIGNKGYLQCEVVGFEKGEYLMMPFGDIEGLFPNAFVFSSGKKLSLSVGKELLGRVLNGAGVPIDGKGAIITREERPPDRDAPNPLDRPMIKDVLSTGVRSIDACLTVGRGQRIGIFSGSGVGKSSLLGMIARYTDADINVISLVGERGKEVNEFLEIDLGEESLRKSVVFIATSNAPKMQQVNCALLATSAAEYFRDQGFHVNLMMDSLTRFAQAGREIATSIKEPVITRGYGPSVFSKLSNLVERAGTDKSGGSITGFYTVLTEPDEMNDPIADAVRGLLDGHIVLSRELAEENHYPAIDIPASISRVMPRIVSEEQLNLAGAVRNLISIYRKSEDLIKLNAYVKGTDVRTDLSIEKKQAIDDFLRQKIEERYSFSDSLSGLKGIFAQVIESEY